MCAQSSAGTYTRVPLVDVDHHGTGVSVPRELCSRLDDEPRGDGTRRVFHLHDLGLLVMAGLPSRRSSEAPIHAIAVARVCARAPRRRPWASSGLLEPTGCDTPRAWGRQSDARLIVEGILLTSVHRRSPTSMNRPPGPWPQLGRRTARAETARTAWIQWKSSELARRGKIPLSAGGDRKEGCWGRSHARGRRSHPRKGQILGDGVP